MKNSEFGSKRKRSKLLMLKIWRQRRARPKSLKRAAKTRIRVPLKSKKSDLNFD